jgi:hypothetical protein
MSKPSNPISVNQIIDSNLDLKCIPEPSCKNLTTDVQAFIDEFCKTKFKPGSIASGCITWDNSTLESLINAIIVKACTSSSTIVSSTENNLSISGLDFCSRDSWNIGEDKCLPLVDTCNNLLTTYTVKDVLRVLIKRLISVEYELETVNTTNVTQQTDINTLKAQVATIQTTCCSQNLVTQIQNLNIRLNAAGIP